MMQRSALLISVAYVAFANAHSFEAMLGARVVSGLASGLIPAAYTYAVKSLAEREQGRGLAILGAARATGAIIGPGVGVGAVVMGSTGILVTIGGISVLTALVATRLPFISGRGKRGTSKNLPRRSPKGKSRLLLYLAIGVALVLSGTVASAVQTALPLFIAEAYGGSIAYIAAGSILALAGGTTIVVAGLGGRLIDSRGTGPASVIASVGGAVALVALAMLSLVRDVPWGLTAVVYAAYCACVTPIGVITAVLIAKLTQSSGVGQGVQNTITQVSATGGPLLASVFVGNYGSGFFVCACLGGLASGVLMIVVRSINSTRGVAHRERFIGGG